MTRDKNSQKAEKKPLSTSEPVTQPQPVISAQSEYPQKARTASAQQPAQKIGSESSAQKSARGSKNTAPAASQKTTAVAYGGGRRQASEPRGFSRCDRTLWCFGYALCGVADLLWRPCCARE